MRPLAVALSFFVILGCSLLIFGLTFLFLSPSNLDHRVEEYNQRVDEWQSKNRRQLSQYQFNLTVLNTQNSLDFPFLPKHEQVFGMVHDKSVRLVSFHFCVKKQFSDGFFAIL